MTAASASAIEHVPPGDWSGLARAFLDHNYRQTRGFGQAMARRQGTQIEFIALRRGEERIGLALLRLRYLPVIGGGLAYIAGGPLVRRREQSETESARCLEDCLRHLRDEYAMRRRLTLRIAPPLGPAPWNARQTEIFARRGFSQAARARPYRTHVVPLDRPLGDIRRTLRQKWRNRLNRSERSSLTVRAGADDKLGATFARLYDEFQHRKQFAVNLDARFHMDIQRRLDDGERFQILLAEHDREVVAGHVSSMLGDTCVYLLGATTGCGRRLQAAYLLQWKAMLSAREHHMRWYDLGGIDPDANPGVCHFKRGLNGLDISAPGPFETAAPGARSALTRRIESVYRSFAAAARLPAA